mmetsp:Transcript_37553/g.85262  ORF Transcript_37553/g.85262 Transcript_37553/m.85262 type:complete len:227 (-) Transcript_37553:134-814(-)
MAARGALSAAAAGAGAGAGAVVVAVAVAVAGAVVVAGAEAEAEAGAEAVVAAAQADTAPSPARLAALSHLPTAMAVRGAPLAAAAAEEPQVAAGGPEQIGPTDKARSPQAPQLAGLPLPAAVTAAAPAGLRAGHGQPQSRCTLTRKPARLPLRAGKQIRAWAPASAAPAIARSRPEPRPAGLSTAGPADIGPPTRVRQPQHQGAAVQASMMRTARVQASMTLAGLV